MMLILTMNAIEKLSNLMLKHPTELIGLVIVLAIIIGIFQAIKSAYMFFVVRPRDPEMYREYRADRRAHEISSSIDMQTREIQRGNMNRDFNDNNNFHNY